MVRRIFREVVFLSLTALAVLLFSLAALVLVWLLYSVLGLWPDEELALLAFPL
jgi:hypothetical protein